MYWVCAGLRAAYKPLWFDEIVTWQVARLPTLRAIWAALHEGVDQETPLTHLAVRCSHALFGIGLLATRLPALIGFWTMLLALYAFLKRRVPAQYALIGMTLPMLTFAWQYSFEARAYGVMLGCAAVALLAWQNVADGRIRRPSLAAIAIALIVGVGSHPFCALIAIPLGLGEAMRTVERKRLDWGVWLAIAAGALGALSFPGSIEATRDWDMTGLQPSLTALPGFYDAAMRSAITPMLIAGLAVCILGRREKMEDAVGPVLPRHEAAALIGCIAVPALFFFGGFVSHRFVFNSRYGLLCVIGVAGALPVVLFRAVGGGRRGWVLLAALVAWLAAARGREAIAMAQSPRVQFEDDNPLLMRALATGSPVVAIDPLTFLAADVYAPADSLARLNYVTADRQTAQRYIAQDLVDQLVIRSARVLPVRAKVKSLREFLERNPTFLFHQSGPLNCVQEELMGAGWRFTLNARRGTATLYEVTAPVSGAARRQ